MRLIKSNKLQVSESKEIPGLLACRIEYEIKTGRGRLDYSGPKFDPAIWHQVMSFFRWTHKEMDSESQVRLYVNTKLGRWGAWAFPQDARTGMSARELPRRKPRNRRWSGLPRGTRSRPDDWLYFGTVHHHCSASAFQSGDG